MKILKKGSILIILLAILIVPVFANESKHIDNYVGGIIWKFYGNDWKTGKLPITEVDSSLVEGVDYNRSWAFTRELVGDVNKLNYLSYDDALKEKQYPGSVCEKISGIGDYVSEKVVCHVVYGYSYLIAEDSEKYEDEKDPSFSYHFFNYNGFEDDLNTIFDVEIEKKYIDGEYILVPKFSLKDENMISTSLFNNKEKGSIQYVFKNLGRIIVEPVNGKLNILEKEIVNNQEETDSNDIETVFSEILTPPKTGI